MSVKKIARNRKEIVAQTGISDTMSANEDCKRYQIRYAAA